MPRNARRREQGRRRKEALGGLRTASFAHQPPRSAPPPGDHEGHVVGYASANLVADLLYGVLNPRIRLGE